MEAKLAIPPYDAEHNRVGYLADLISDVLASAGHKRPTAWLKEVTPDVVKAELTHNEQRFLINRYWRNVLGEHGVAANVSTQHERYDLVDQGEIVIWLGLFTENVAPFIVQNDLG